MPLANVAHYSERLAEGIDNIETDADLKASLQGIQASSIGLTQLVEDIISLAELETGEAATVYQLQAQPIFNLDFAVEEGTKQAQNVLSRFESDVVVHCDDNLPAVFGVSTILSESVQRLIEAGIRLQQTKQTVEVKTTAVSNQVEIAVCLSHPLNEEQVETINELFRENKAAQFDPSSYDPGLRIAEGSVHLHNGRLRLQSTTEGTIFTIQLPVYKAP